MTTPVPPPLLPTDILAAVTWIATIPGFTPDMVGGTLPPDVDPATNEPAAWLRARTSTAITPGAGQTSLANFLQSGSSNNAMALTSQPGGTGSITSSFSWTTADMASEIAVALVAG